MSRSAKFAANGFVYARIGELQGRFTDRARQDLHVIFGSIDRQRMYNVSARDSQVNGNSRRDHNTMRYKHILLSDHAQSDRTIRILLSPQIAFHELP